MTANWLIIPIETKVREFYGKSLLAVCAAEAGMQVVIGDQRVIAQSLHHLPRAVYVEKSVCHLKTGHFQRLRKMGFSIVAWCEEGLAYRDKTAYQFERITQKSLSQVDAFFAWGQSQSQDVVEAVPTAAGKMHVHGNPRFDLLRSSLRTVFDQDARDLVSAYGRYILVNTNFSRYNRFEGRDDVIDVLRARGITLNEDQKDYYRESVQHIGEVFREFVTAIPLLARAFPETTIIVRPHPSENHDRWRTEMAGLANVQVHHEGNVIPWMMGAEAVIHNACTTGVEAFLLDRPTIAYVPVQHEIFNRLTYFPNAIGSIALNVDELSALASRALSRQTPFDPAKADKKEMVAHHVANASGALATERIVQVLTSLQQNNKRPNSLTATGARLLSLLRFKAARARRALRPDPVLKAYMDQKFPDLTLSELQDALRRIADARGLTSVPEVTIHPRLPSCFVIRKATQ